MLKLSRQTDYALILLRHLTVGGGCAYSAKELAESVGLSPMMTAKILKILARHDLVSATRGAQGGYKLAVNPFETSVQDVITAVQGRFGLTDCMLDHDQAGCEMSETCTVKSTLDQLNAKIDEVLARTSLAEVAGLQPRVVSLIGVAQ